MSAASFHFVSVILDLKVDKHRFKKVSTLKKLCIKLQYIHAIRRQLPK